MKARLSGIWVANAQCPYHAGLGKTRENKRSSTRSPESGYCCAALARSQELSKV
jgi:hypothetical protein